VVDFLDAEFLIRTLWASGYVEAITAIRNQTSRH
jgi:hypothetical protein